MTPETLARIFEPYFTTKPPDRGSGLGMAMVYGLMKQHLGYVLVNSTLGVGTEVRLYFPVSAHAVEATVPEAPPPYGRTSARPSWWWRIRKRSGALRRAA